MITDHVWRPLNPTTTQLIKTPFRRRPCAFMSCRRLIAEHARAVTFGGVR